MKWYVTRLVFQIICGEGKHTAQFDEQLCLIEAEDEGKAMVKAVDLGINREEQFYNQRQELVQWKFINVAEVEEFHLIDGTEICSRINEVDDEFAYTKMVHAKAEQIKRDQSQKLLHPL